MNGLDEHNEFFGRLATQKESRRKQRRDERIADEIYKNAWNAAITSCGTGHGMRESCAELAQQIDSRGYADDLRDLKNELDGVLGQSTHEDIYNSRELNSLKRLFCELILHWLGAPLGNFDDYAAKVLDVETREYSLRNAAAYTQSLLSGRVRRRLEQETRSPHDVVAPETEAAGDLSSDQQRVNELELRRAKYLEIRARQRSGEAVKKILLDIGVARTTYYRWRSEFG